MATQWIGQAAPDQPGWYWVCDEEVVSGDKWIMVRLVLESNKPPRLFAVEPHFNGERWMLWPWDWDEDGQFWYSVSDEAYSEISPSIWIKCESPTNHAESDRQKFIDHLEHATQLVRSWPDRL